MVTAKTVGKIAAGAFGIVIAILFLLAFGVAVGQFAEPIEDGTYTGQKIDYSHQRGFIFQTNDLTTKTNDRSSTVEDWCVPDGKDELVRQVRSIEDGESVTIDYHRPIWIWPDTCDGGLKVIDSIKVKNDTV